jgi:hypothetical protein
MKIAAYKFFERPIRATNQTLQERTGPGACPGEGKRIILKGLILAQNERWRRGLGMQVERIPEGLLSGGSGERGSKAWVTYPGDRHSPPNGGVILGDVTRGHLLVTR